jgi:metallo-beta-lactamase family protein
MSKNLSITFYGGVGSVTGANFLLEGEHTKILVDCGLLQGTEEAYEVNKKLFPYDTRSIQYLFITHAHLDHIGRVPKLVREGFNGTIYSTEETKELAHLMFLDALKIMDAKERESGQMEPSLYKKEDVEKTISLWKTLSYDTESKLNDEFSVYLKDAGHILGSAMYQFTYDGKKIVFTGDSGNSPSPLLKNTEPIEGADYLVVDSVYGDKNHESKEERDQRFKEIIEDTIRKNGALVIPAFSIERTQVILYELNNLIEEKKIPSVPVFLDSPLGSKVTEVYKRRSKDFNSEVQKEIKSGDNIFNFPKLVIIHGNKESESIENVPNPKIVIAGSGMSSGGRVVYHEMNFLPDPKSTILLMGYQAIGTLGREIENKPKEINIRGTIVSVRARIEMISGYSSHKDSDHLVEMVENTAKTVKKVFVVMGEPKSSIFLVQRLRDELDVDAIYPERGKPYILN